VDEVARRHRRHRITVDAAAAVGTVILVGHGLIHLMGVALLWGLGRPGALRYSDVRPAAESAWGVAVGAGWLAAVLLFVTAAVLVLRHRRWRPVAAVAALVSLAVLAPSASVAAAGLAVDVAVLLAVLVATLRAHATAPPR
jgi:hypothetical protein